MDHSNFLAFCELLKVLDEYVWWVWLLSVHADVCPKLMNIIMLSDAHFSSVGSVDELN